MPISVFKPVPMSNMANVYMYYQLMTQLTALVGKNNFSVWCKLDLGSLESRFVHRRVIHNRPVSKHVIVIFIIATYMLLL